MVQKGTSYLKGEGGGWGKYTKGKVELPYGNEEFGTRVFSRQPFRREIKFNAGFSLGGAKHKSLVGREWEDKKRWAGGHDGIRRALKVEGKTGGRVSRVVEVCWGGVRQGGSDERGCSERNSNFYKGG